MCAILYEILVIKLCFNNVEWRLSIRNRILCSIVKFVSYFQKKNESTVAFSE